MTGLSKTMKRQVEQIDISMIDLLKSEVEKLIEDKK